MATIGMLSAEIGDVQVELERAGLWFGLIQEDQPRWDICRRRASYAARSKVPCRVQ